MSREVKRFAVDVMEDGSAIVLARIVVFDSNGTTAIAGEGYPAKQSDLSSITYSVAATDDLSTVVTSGTPTVSAVIFDTLQTHTVWTDATGYNFKYTLGPTAFPTGGKVYRVEFKLTFTGGLVGWLQIDCTAKAVATS